MTDRCGQPAFANRAYMLDVSRGRVPRRATLEWLIGVLSQLGFTELHLYVEHTFAYPGHEDVWRDASPLTANDMSWLAERASAAGVRVVPNLNCFGHMERWLRHDRYRPRAECPDGYRSPFDGRTSPPSCLAPTAENAELALELIRAQLDAVGGTATPADRVMIGADEPFELGLGQSRDQVAAKGRLAVYIEHVNRLAEPLVADGIEVMIWGDQFRRDPAALGDLADGVTVVPWNYEKPGPAWSASMSPEVVEALGLPDDDHLGCLAHVRSVAAADRPFWVAAGTGSWNSLIGRNVNAQANIDDTATVGSERGADGILICDWGDFGHWQPLVVSLPSLVRAGQAAMTGSCADMAGPDDVGPIIDGLLGAEPGTGARLDRLGRLGEQLGSTMVNGTPLAAAVFDMPFPVIGEVEQDAVAAAIAELEESSGEWAAALPNTERASIIAEELEAATAAAMMALRRLAGRSVEQEQVDLVRSRQRAAWHRANQPGHLEESLSGFR